MISESSKGVTVSFPHSISMCDWTIEALLGVARERLGPISLTPALDARLLLAHASHSPSEYLFAHGPDRVKEEVAADFFELIRRRSLAEPVAYLTGRREFWGLEFEVNPSVLIPRPETELLVDAALRALPLPKESSDLDILDLGTGTGCIAVAFASELRVRKRKVKIVATDVSREALAIAARNITRHECREEILLVCGDWLSALSQERRFHFILSNPPYLRPGDPLASPELAYEPQRALYAGESGRETIEHILTEGRSFLRPGGRMLVEVGSSQAGAVAETSASLGYREIEVLSDLAGIERVVSCRRE